MDLDMITKLLSLLEGGQDAALAVITRTAGSTPRETGTKMIVTADREIYGTVGGGLGEEIIKRECLKALEIRNSFTHHISLTGDITANEGMICGGTMDVFVDYISKEDEYSRKVLTKYVQSVHKNEKPVLVMSTGIKGEAPVTPGRKVVILAGGYLIGDLGSAGLNSLAASAADAAGKNIKPGLITAQLDNTRQVEFFIEPGILNPEVLILGGGHIALPLVSIASLLGFKVTVVDDRQEFANAGRFPGAYRVICDSFEATLERLDIGPGTYTIIVTRGHQHDRDCLRKVITCPAAYIGMIGSRKKIKAVMNQLAEEGIPREKLAAVYSPIGLDIRAETPAEIAVSIMAEVINVYRNGRAATEKPHN